MEKKSDEMTATVLFDGKVLRLESPIDLEPHARYTITISKVSKWTAVKTEASKDTKAKTEDAWDLLERLSGTIDAPADWSEEHDHYIHGVPKRSEIKGT